MSGKRRVARKLRVGPLNALALVCLAICFAGCGPSIQTGLEDAQLTMRVKTALLNDSELGTAPIDVAVRGGRVQLSGRVARAEQIARAERLVRGSPACVRSN